MTAVAESAVLEITFRLPRNTLPNKQRHFNIMGDFLREHLQAAGVTGRFIYNATEQAKNRGHCRFQILTSREPRSIHLRLRPGDNASCWEGYLIPEDPLEVPAVTMRLQKMVTAKYGVQPKPHAGLPVVTAPETKPEPAPEPKEQPRQRHPLPPRPPTVEAKPVKPAPAPTPAPVASGELLLPEVARKIVERFGWPLPVHVGMDLWCCATEVTPEQALDILDEFNTHNRNPRKRHISIYKGDIDSDLWGLTHQGIAFDQQGELSDGQNRLFACAESDSFKPIKTVIFFNLGVDARSRTDVGANRNIRDISKLAGQPIAAMESAMLRRSLQGFDYNLRRSEMSATALMGYRDRHIQAVRWVQEQFAEVKGRIHGVTTAPVYAALFGAFYHEDPIRLAEFSQVLITGIAPHETDHSAIYLRNALTGSRQSGALHSTNVYRKVERTILAFCRREKYDRIYPAGKELYPVPEDPAAVLRRRAMHTQSPAAADTSSLTESV